MSRVDKDFWVGRKKEQSFELLLQAYKIFSNLQTISRRPLLKKKNPYCISKAKQ